MRRYFQNCISECSRYCDNTKDDFSGLFVKNATTFFHLRSISNDKKSAYLKVCRLKSQSERRYRSNFQVFLSFLSCASPTSRFSVTRDVCFLSRKRQLPQSVNRTRDEYLLLRLQCLLQCRGAQPRLSRIHRKSMRTLCRQLQADKNIIFFAALSILPSVSVCCKMYRFINNIQSNISLYVRFIYNILSQRQCDVK